MTFFVRRESCSIRSDPDSYSYSSSSQRILQIWQVNQPGIQCPRSDTVCSEPQRRHLGFGVISRFFTSTSGITEETPYSASEDDSRRNFEIGRFLHLKSRKWTISNRTGAGMLAR